LIVARLSFTALDIPTAVRLVLEFKEDIDEAAS
jgi:hypothetical protein